MTDPQPAHPAPGTPVAVDARDLVHALTADHVQPLIPKEIG